MDKETDNNLKLIYKSFNWFFFTSLVVLSASEFLIHRHHHFKIGETLFFEAGAGFLFILILGILSRIFKLLFFKP